MLTDSQLRVQLSEWISGEFVITDKGELETMSASEGVRVEARDEYLAKYRSRLASLQKLKFVPAGLLRDHIQIITILESLLPGETLTYWEAKTSEYEYCGVSSRFGVVSFYGPNPRE